MRLIVCFTIVVLTTTLTIQAVSGEQQRILRRVIKSTPTANQLTRIRAITVRSPNAETGGVTEISSKEAASFGQRSANETIEQQQSSTSQQQQAQQQTSSGLKTKFITSTTSAPTTSPTSSSTTTTTTTTTTTSKPQIVESSKKNKASDRQQAGVEVELLSSAPSSWQTMTAVEAPAAMLIATGARAASTSDLASAGSTLYSSEESASQTGDFLRASGTKGGSSYNQQSNNEAFSRLRQQSSKTQQQQQQQSFFYPQEQRVSSGKTSFASKTPWYQTTTTTTPRPAPLIQQEQQYEQQNEQYVEQQQQQQVEYGAPAPLGQAEPFAFDFKTQDNSGNGQYRKEESDKNGVVRGSYGYTDANGIYRHVEYVADQNGFRANIKSNEPGLIGETQPASIQLAGGAAPARVTSPRASPANNNNDNGDWISSSASNNQGSSADLALAPPEFESSHKPERARLPRQYRN